MPKVRRKRKGPERRELNVMRGFQAALSMGRIGKQRATARRALAVRRRREGARRRDKVWGSVVGGDAGV